MKLMKKAVSTMLALAMTASVFCVPAAAEDGKMPTAQGLKPVSLKLSEKDDANAKYPRVKTNIKQGAYSKLIGDFDLDDVSIYTAIEKDTVFTVHNKGGLKDCFLMVNLATCVPMTKEEIISTYNPYTEEDYQSKDILYMKAGEIAYTYEYYIDGAAWLTKDKAFMESGEGPYPDFGYMVEEGESVSFTIPDAKEDVLYYMQVQARYPDSDYYYWTNNYFMVNEDKVEDYREELEAEKEEVPVEVPVETPVEIPEEKPAETPVQMNFTDVKEADWFFNPVYWAVENKVTSGTTATTFSPNQTCTRGQIITFLWKAAGSPEPQVMTGFFDVAADKYYCKAANWAKEMGMAAGTAFSPEAPCTRAMAVEFLWKLNGSPEMDAKTAFTDVNANAAYADAVAWAVENKVTAGTSETTFSPDATCTRAQIMTFLYKTFGK